jgi:hypothetical protein
VSCAVDNLISARQGSSSAAHTGLASLVGSVDLVAAGVAFDRTFLAPECSTVPRRRKGRRPGVPRFTYRLLSYLAAEAPAASLTDAVETLEHRLDEAGAEGYRLTGVLQLPTGGVLILEREAEPSLDRSPISDREP